MTLETIKRDDYAREIGLIAVDGAISERGLTALVRLPLARWGLSTKAAVLGYARNQLEAAGLREQASQQVGRQLEKLVLLRECERVWIDGEEYLAPAQPIWLRTGRDSASLLGVAPIPDGIVEQPLDQGTKDIVRRILVRNEQDLAALRVAGVREMSFDEWLQPVGFRSHAERRLGRPIRSDAFSLADFWNLLAAAVQDEGLPLGDDAEVRIVSGPPGTYFGKHDSEQCQGRWSEDASNGVWCAYRRGYSQAHWHPMILAIDGSHRQALDLFDRDEWCWALLARGNATGEPENSEWHDGVVQVHSPSPNQLIAGMDLLGPRRSPWSWLVNDGAPDLWKIVT